MKKMYWKIIGICAAVAAVLLWFYLPFHPKIKKEASTEVWVRPQLPDDVVPEDRDKAQILEAVEKLKCQRQVFLFTKVRSFETKKTVEISLHEEMEFPIHIYLYLNYPEDSYIDMRQKKYAILNPEVLIELMDEIYGLNYDWN